MTTLVLGPLLALTLASATQTVAGTTTIAVNRTEALVVPLAKPELRHMIAPPTATPAPPAPPAPVPKPAAKPRAAARPVIAAAAVNPNSVIAIIEAAAARWGVSGAWMVKIARCESGLRPTAYNPGGPYIGLFQFLRSTFSHNGGTNIYDAADQANITAKMLAHGQAYQWSCA